MPDEPDRRMTVRKREICMQSNNEYITIDVMKIVNGLVKRIWIILIAMAIGGAALFSYATFFVTPLYEASVLMYVNNSQLSVGATAIKLTSSDISAARGLVDTYQVILKARMTLEDVIRIGELDCSYESLKNMIKTETVNETEVFSVTVTCDDPHEAEHIANTIARVLPDKISNIVEGSSVRVVDYAVVPSGKVSPSISKYTIIGMLLGMLASCGVIAVIEIMDDRVRTEDYLLQNFGEVPLLAAIPDMLDTRSKGNYYYKKHGYYRRHGYYGYEQSEEENRGKEGKHDAKQHDA